jgi:hypothetical protein
MKKIFLIIPLVFVFLHFMPSSDGPGIWTQTLFATGPIWQDCIVFNSTNQQTMYAGSTTTGIWKSTNGGVNWAQSNGGLNNLSVQSLAISKSNPNILYCGTSSAGGGAGMYISTNAGVNWTQINSGIVEALISIQAIAIDPLNPAIAYIAVFEATVDAIQGVYKTTNSGTTWVPANTGIGVVKNVLSIVINPLNSNVIYCGTSFGVTSQLGPVHIYKSNNAAASWTDISSGLPALGTDLNPVRSMSMSNVDTTRILAGLFQNTLTGGAFLTTNGGTTWVRQSTGIPNVIGVQIRSVLIRPGSTTQFYAGLDNVTTGGVYRTTDAGATWTAFNGGSMLATCVVRALTFRTSPDSTLFAGVAGATAQGGHEYSFPLVGINDPHTGIPTEYNLSQNYPNPFNPTTVINYALPKASYVTLKIYDISGREVSTLVSEEKSTGYYNVTFNASGLSSGVYFYKLTAGNFTQTKKLNLVK